MPIFTQGGFYMFSIKDGIRRTITVTIAAAMITTVFTGCSSKENSSNSSVSSSISMSFSSSISSSSSILQSSSSTTPGADTSTDVTDNSLFHWVEEPAGSEAAVTASEFIADNNCQVDTDESKYDLPVYTNGSERYVHAGNLLLSLDEDGAFVNEEDEMLVRHVHEPYTDGGAKIYLYRNKKGELRKLSDDNLEDNEDISKYEDISKRSDDFWKVLNGRVVVDHNSYVTKVAAEGNDADIPDNALVWYNGITTDIRSKGEMIPLKVLTNDFVNILDYTKNESGYAFNLYTGIGTVGINAVQVGNSWVFKYSIPTNCKLEHPDVTLPSTAIAEADGEVYVSDEVLKQVFKYFVFAFIGVDMGDGNTDDIAVIITDNQDIIKSSSTAAPDSDTSSSEPTSDTHEPTTSEPTSDTHEPTSSSGDNTSKPTSSSSSSSTSNTSKPTSSSSQPTTSKPTSSSSSSGGNTSTPASPYWNPDAPGNTPGPYGGYYDANGALHCKDADMPRDSYGAPVKSFYTEDGRYIMTKAEKDAARAEEERIAEGGLPNTSGIDLSDWTW